MTATAFRNLVTEMISRDDFLLDWYEGTDLIADPASGYALLPTAQDLIEIADRVSVLFADGYGRKLDNAKARRARSFAELVRDEAEAAITLYEARQRRNSFAA